MSRPEEWLLTLSANQLQSTVLQVLCSSFQWTLEKILKELGMWVSISHSHRPVASETGPEKLEQVPMLTSLAVMKPEAQPGGSGKPVHLLGSWACDLTGFVRSVPSASQKQDCWAPVWAAENGEYTVVLSSVTIYVPGSKSHSPCAHACLFILEHKFFGYFSSDCSLVMVANSLVLI